MVMKREDAEAAAGTTWLTFTHPETGEKIRLRADRVVGIRPWMGGPGGAMVDIIGMLGGVLVAESLETGSKTPHEEAANDPGARWY
jgi:hypothetical protein